MLHAIMSGHDNAKRRPSSKRKCNICASKSWRQSGRSKCIKAWPPRSQTTLDANRRSFFETTGVEHFGSGPKGSWTRCWMPQCIDDYDAFTQDISIILFLQAVHARVMSYAGRFLADYYQVPQRVIFVSRSNSSEYEELQ